jgi:3-oxoacyl-[acyl-carrier protein] reductase
VLERFSERTAVVTGGGGGIGAATARRLAAEGAAVAILDRDGGLAEATASGLRSAGARALAVQCDVTSSSDVDGAMDRVVQELGSLDVLVNNAGLTRDQLLFRMTDDDWDVVIDVNLKGAFLCTRAAQRHMVANKYGRIVNLSSTSALGNRGQANYAAAKAGLQGLTRTLAIELGPFGITVNAVGPGYIATGMTEATAQRVGMEATEHQRLAAEANPLKRVGQPEDVASVIAFLASDDASYVSGQVLYISGGAR